MELHLDEIDLEVLRQQYNALSQMKKKYEAQKREIERENERIETVAKVIDETVRRHSKSITDRQKKSTAFLERTTSLKDSLKEIIGQSKSIQRYRPTIENTQVNFLSNTVQDYNFVSRLTVKEIKNDLKNEYNINLNGIKYDGGLADYSSISVAHISTKEIVMRAQNLTEENYKKIMYGYLKPDSKDYERYQLQQIMKDTFHAKKRTINFKYADMIAAEKGIKIPGLKEGYTWKELETWRDENKFTWDEQLSNGYNLVPSIIHNNLSHSGLVSNSKNAYFVLKDPNMYYCSEDDASISIKELKTRVNKNNKGDVFNMGRKLLRSREKDTRFYSKEIEAPSTQEIGKEVNDCIKLTNRLDDVVKEYAMQRDEIIERREYVENLNVPIEDKEQLLKDLEDLLKRLYEKYEHRIREGQEFIMAKLNEAYEQTDGTINDLNEYHVSLGEMSFNDNSISVDDTRDNVEDKINRYNQTKDYIIQKSQDINGVFNDINSVLNEKK
jgi:hypothetical protein